MKTTMLFIDEHELILLVCGLMTMSAQITGNPIEPHIVELARRRSLTLPGLLEKLDVAWRALGLDPLPSANDPAS